MNGNNENSSLKPISLRKEDYPEIYGSSIVPIEEIQPEEKLLPEKTRTEQKPVFEKIVGSEVFNDYIFTDERVLWCCRGSASAKSGMAKVLPFATVLSLAGFVIDIAACAYGEPAALFAGTPLLALGAGAVVRYIRGAYDSYFAITNNRILYICGKEFKTEYLYKIEKAEVYQTGKKTADLKLSISDGDITVLEGLALSYAKEIKIRIENERQNGRPRL